MKDAQTVTNEIIEITNTIQGEGPGTGRYVTLIRFKRCNLNCKFPVGDGIEVCPCDTQDKMKKEGIGIDLDGIKEQVSNTNRLMFTGGEPTLYVDNIIAIVKFLLLNGVSLYSVEVETNGFKLEELHRKVESEGLLNHTTFEYVWSPKIHTEKMFEENVEKLQKLLNIKNVNLKIVAFDEDVVSDFLEKIPITDLISRTWIMPVGVTADEQRKYFRKAMTVIERYPVKFSARIHLFYQID